MKSPFIPFASIGLMARLTRCRILNAAWLVGNRIYVASPLDKKSGDWSVKQLSILQITQIGKLNGRTKTGS